jgi:putative isomerase
LESVLFLFNALQSVIRFYPIQPPCSEAPAEFSYHCKSLKNDLFPVSRKIKDSRISACSSFSAGNFNMSFTIHLRNNFRIGIILWFALLFKQRAHAQLLRNQFADVLDVRTIISDTSTVEHSFFSDQGAWFAFALPVREEDNGAFIGPLIMKTQGTWLANSFSKLLLTENGKRYDLSKCKPVLHYYPGLLSQEFDVNGLQVKLELIFVSSAEALIHTQLANRSSSTRRINIAWSGQLLASAKQLHPVGKSSITITDSTDDFSITFSHPVECVIDSLHKSYCTKQPELLLASNETKSFQQVCTYFPGKHKEPEATLFFDYPGERKKNEARWNDYLQVYFSGTKLDVAKQRMAVKAMITLITNWRAAAGDLLHDGVFPSASYQGFYGFWSWDSWKQAAALSYFNVALAQSTILSMFDYQNNEGMIADCIYYDKRENNWRDTKPPLAAWSVWQVYQQSHDMQFLKKMYPLLVRYHNWWYANRDHNQNKLCEYGSTDGSKIAAKWESGMDNAVRFDSCALLKNNENAWSLNIESVDLNAYLYEEKKQLQAIAALLGNTIDVSRFQEEARELKNKMNKTFYDPVNGFYYDKFISGEFIRTEASEGFLPLWAGIPDSTVAERIIHMILQENKFNTHVPFPTLCADQPLFDPLNGYWRGPVWLDQFYFGVEGMKRYHHDSIANLLVEKLLNHAKGLYTAEPIRENYHPLTGEGLNAMNFSWSAAHLLLMLREQP